MAVEVITVTNGLEFSFETCVECGCRFGMPLTLNRELRKTHATFYCPSGHQQYYAQKTKEEQLREDLHAERVKNMNLEEKIERHDRLAKAGCCPKCGQHIRDLERHMKRKHKGVK